MELRERAKLLAEKTDVYEIILDRCQKNDDSSSASKVFDEFFNKEKYLFPSVGFAYIRLCLSELLNQVILLLPNNRVKVKLK